MIKSKKKKKKSFIRIYGIICTFIFIGPTQLQKESRISTTREKDPFSIFLEVLFCFFYFHSFESAFMMHTITNSLTIFVPILIKRQLILLPSWFRSSMIVFFTIIATVSCYQSRRVSFHIMGTETN